MSPRGCMPMVLLWGWLCIGSATVFGWQSVEEPNEEIRLFNGSDLEGWNHAGNWIVRDGAIFRERAGGPLTYGGGPLPDDFELRFEWKVAEGSNSGIYYRPGQYEYQILDNDRHDNGTNPRTTAASLYFCMPPSQDATRDVGQWNTGRIVCQGTIIQHWLNGVKVVDFDYTDPRWAENVELLRRRGGDVKARGGTLWLQDHGDPVWFRALTLRHLSGNEPLDRTPITPVEVPDDVRAQEEAKLRRLEAGR